MQQSTQLEGFQLHNVAHVGLCVSF